ncbi:MAG: helix-turn-helix domain-containing protein [Candidatus Symbiothrix sp.]|jgi:y4mF family transcriptional regulator|nr:helix-turn-helix domain-containing protein [Candidatus Symbiothrix sp.]
MKFAKQIKERRSVLGINQQDLADISGVGLRTIKQIEVGKGNPSIKTLSAILDVLGMELVTKIKTTSEL